MWERHLAAIRAASPSHSIHSHFPDENQIGSNGPEKVQNHSNAFSGGNKEAVGDQRQDADLQPLWRRGRSGTLPGKRAGDCC